MVATLIECGVDGVGVNNWRSAPVFVINVTNIVLYYSSHIGVGALLSF